MGRIVTPKYRVEYADNLLALKKTAPDTRTLDGRDLCSVAWREDRPTAKALEDWRRTTNRSFLPGGANEHVTRAYDIVPHIYYARVVRQSDGAQVCEVRAPLFEIV
jgi:hypothetical protein